MHVQHDTSAPAAHRSSPLDDLSWMVGHWEGEGIVRRTKVVVRRGSDQRPARRVAQALGAGSVVVDVDTLRRVDVSVILGQDWQPPAGLGW